jgi:allantoinase
LEAVAAVGLPLLVHAEAPGPLAAAPPAGRDYPSYLASRPAEAETEAIAAVIEAVRRTGGRAHILHLSAADALPLLESARGDGLPITVETCPHYLTFCSDDIRGEACEFKCAPPIRDAGNRERLWDGLAAGSIDMVVSDHSPCSPILKKGGFDRAWGGIASLELRLPVIWTEAAKRGFGLTDVVRWTATAPADFAAIPSGLVESGRRADLVIWDPDAGRVVDGDRLFQRHPVTPYAGRDLRGEISATLVRGEVVFDDGQVTTGTGNLLERK